MLRGEGSPPGGAVISGPAQGSEQALCVALMPHAQDLEDIKLLLQQIIDLLAAANQAGGQTLSPDPLKLTGA